MEWIVVALLAAWFAVTLLYQCFLRRLRPLAWRWDVFRVVPSWHLYTEVPRELGIWFRDARADGTPGDWRRLPLRRTGRCGHALFNPDLFAADAVFSLAEYLRDAARAEPPVPGERLVASAGWRGVWLEVRSQPVEPGAMTRQFELRERALTDGAREAVIYTSAPQPLASGKEGA